MPRPAHEASGQQRPFGALAGPRCCDVTKPPELLDRAMLPSRWRYLAMKAFEATKISLAKLAKLAALRRENNYDPRDKLGSAGELDHLAAVVDEPGLFTGGRRKRRTSPSTTRSSPPCKKRERWPGCPSSGRAPG